MEKIRETPCSSARPHGNQTALYHAPRGRPFFWLRAEIYFCPSGDRTPAEPFRTRLLSLAKLCAVPLDSRRGNQKTSTGELTREGRPQNIFGFVLETTFHSSLELHPGDSERRTR